MKADEIAAEIAACKHRLADLRQSMESVRNKLLSAIGDAFVSWYDSQMKATVKEQHHLVGKLGPSGMATLKERFMTFLKETGPIVRNRLSEARFWSHMQDSLSGPFAKADAYRTSQSGGFSSLVQKEMERLFARLDIFLRENGFPAASNGVQAQTMSSSMAVRDMISQYGTQHQELIEKITHLPELDGRLAEAITREKQQEEQRQVEQAKSAALDVWENAFTLRFGQDIDWDKAWEKANDIDDSEWSDHYDTWLIATRPKVDEDSFETFLISTGNVKIYERFVKRHWKVGMMKAVLRQLGKVHWETWMQQLVEEQIAKRDVAELYGNYEVRLESYQNRVCVTCLQYSVDETCYSCLKCPGCCTCDCFGASD